MKRFFLSREVFIIMIHTSKSGLKRVIASEYMKMVSESRNLSEEQIQELKFLQKMRDKFASKKQTPPAEPEGDMELDDKWFDDDAAAQTAPGLKIAPPQVKKRAEDTQTQMRTADIARGSKKPIRRKSPSDPIEYGEIKESQFRSFISKIVKNTLK